MSKRAHLAFEIHPLLALRWSPRAFSDRKVEPSVLRALFEAARWAPSCFNDQPWHFVVATRQETDAFARLVGCLAESNQRWAKHAGALAISVARSTFSANGKPNRHAWHDVGLAVAQLTAQASSEGLCVHQMAGLDAGKAREALRIPEGFEPVTAIAIGYPGDPSALPEDLREREAAPRARKGQETFLFGAGWGTPWRGAEPEQIEEVLSFWFGDVGADGLSSLDSVSRWWKKDPAFDDEIKSRFGSLHAAIARGERDPWLKSARGRLAYVIVLDQFSRNMFRDTPAMFATDPQALAAAIGAVELGMDRTFGGDQRAFFYLPFMHSEVLAVQDRCVALFEALHGELEGAGKERIGNNLKFAIAHRDIVAKWGRFPHRNAILGRDSTPEEEAFLTQPGSSF